MSTGTGASVQSTGQAPASARAAATAAFLDTAGFGGARVEWMPGDASFRRYARLEGGPVPALLMDAPPDHEDVRPWLSVARHLRALGLRTPAIHAADDARGLLVIEDFGDDTFTRLLARGADEGVLYDLAIDALVHLHGIAPERAAPDWLPPYDDERLLAEVALFVDWYLPALRGRATETAERDEYLGLWREILPLARPERPTLVLRDYHVDNLMRVPGSGPTERCGLLDFQDAVAGHPAYDLISLIEDARRDLGPGIAARARERYFSALPDANGAAFDAAGAVLAAARNAKIIGIFTRLLKRDGKPRYLAHIPRVWRLLEGDLAHPALGPVARWFDRAVPAVDRRAPRAVS